MSSIETFNFTGHQLRVVTIDGAPWFVAADVCRAVGFKNPSVSVRPLGQDERAKKFLGRGPEVLLISEGGLYKLVLRAHRSNPDARQFQDWVTREVLPAIRKDGAYIQGEEKVRTGEMSEDELILKAVTILQQKVERLTAERDVLAAEVNRVTVDEYRALICSDRPPTGGISHLQISRCPLGFLPPQNGPLEILRARYFARAA